jgi:hypothetical protein
MSQIKTLRPGDADFVIQDGFILAHRAGFEIANDCPREYMQVIQKCYQRGWLKPVAHMIDYEYTMDKLKETL